MREHVSLADGVLEAAARAEGYANVCGVDEAGAGPLMGRCTPPQSFCRRAA